MTTSDDEFLRDVLSRVASGDLNPEEAARLLDEDPTAPTVDQSELPPAAPAIHAVTIRAGGVKLVVVADPSVATAVADGPHAVRLEDGTMTIDAPGSDGYRVEPPPRLLGWLPTVWTGGRGERITVRVNPRLPLTVDATACAAEVIGMNADVTVTGISSSVKVIDHRGPIHGGLAMGSLHVVGAVTGPSTVSCELGSVHLRLIAGSDVTVHAAAELGNVTMAGAQGKSRVDGFDGSTSQSMTVGAGSDPLDVSVRMGSVTVVAA